MKFRARAPQRRHNTASRNQRGCPDRRSARIVCRHVGALSCFCFVFAAASLAAFARAAADRGLGMYPNNVARVLRGEQNMAGGFKWRATRMLAHAPPALLTTTEQLDAATGQVLGRFVTVATANRNLGLCNVGKALSGGQRTAGGFKWRYLRGKDEIEDKDDVEDEEAEEEEEEEEQEEDGAEEEEGAEGDIEQLDADTGEVITRYSSSNAADRALGLSHDVVAKVLRGQHRTAGGFRWQYRRKQGDDDDDDDDDSEDASAEEEEEEEEEEDGAAAAQERIEQLDAGTGRVLARWPSRGALTCKGERRGRAETVACAAACWSAAGGGGGSRRWRLARREGGAGERARGAEDDEKKEAEG